LKHPPVSSVVEDTEKQRKEWTDNEEKNGE
jgi:hypothetical protein